MKLEPGMLVVKSLTSHNLYMLIEEVGGHTWLVCDLETLSKIKISTHALHASYMPASCN